MRKDLANVLSDLKCPECGKVFHPDRRGQRFCSRTCYFANRKKRLGRCEWYCRKEHPDCKYLVMDDGLGSYCCTFDIEHPEINGGAFQNGTCVRYEKE